MKLYNKARGSAALGVLVVFIATVLQLAGSVQQDEFVTAHNKERFRVGVAGLVWNNTVASYAQSYGEKQRDEDNCALVHSGGRYGENLFWTSALSVSPTDAVSAWISEKMYYDIVSNTCSTGKVCSQYTQVVWENSVSLGCAIIACNNSGGNFIICNYDPPGNIIGERPYSVPSPAPSTEVPSDQPSPSPSPSPSISPSPAPSLEVPYDRPSPSSTAGTPSPSSPAEIAIAIASSFAICVGLGFAIVLYSRARKRKLLNKQARQAEGELIEVLPLLPTTFSYQDLQEATKRFSELLGAGGCGSVYAGILQDGRKVAVKTLELVSKKDQSKQFLAELATIGQTTHHNIVRLVGFCWEASRRLLVYEYMERGSLDHWLFHKPPTDGSGDHEGVAPLLDWQTRYNVVIGIVQGLSYLHEECPQTILHFDIKPSNILLDGAFVAKLADFGMSRLMQRDISKVRTSGLRGTPGYIAPEWLLHGVVSKKGDIYSLGMVMLEIVGGRKNVDLELLNNFEAGLEGDDEDEPWHFPSWAARKCEQGLEMELVDKRLKGAFNEVEVKRLIYTAFWCIQEGSFPIKKPPFLSVSNFSVSSKPSSSPRFSL